MKRVGPKGTGISAFEKISWGEALDLTVASLKQSAEAHGLESVWFYFYAGTRGWIQRDGIDRLRHVWAIPGNTLRFVKGYLTQVGWWELE